MGDFDPLLRSKGPHQWTALTKAPASSLPYSLRLAIKLDPDVGPCELSGSGKTLKAVLNDGISFVEGQSQFHGFETCPGDGDAKFIRGL